MTVNRQLLPKNQLRLAKAEAPQFSPAFEERCFNDAHGNIGYRWKRAEVYQGHVICSVGTGDSGGYIYLIVSPDYERRYPISGFHFQEDGAIAEARATVEAQGAVGYQWTKAELYRGHVICSVDIDDAGGWIYLIVSPHYQQNFPITGVNAKGESAWVSASRKINGSYYKRALQAYLLKHPASEFVSDEEVAEIAGIYPHERHPRGRSGPLFRPSHLQRRLPTDVYLNE